MAKPEMPDRRMRVIPGGPMVVLESKTRAIVIGQRDDTECIMSIDDTGYIDGYVQGHDGLPYAVFVRDEDGKIELLLPECLQAQAARPIRLVEKEDGDDEG